MLKSKHWALPLGFEVSSIGASIFPLLKLSHDQAIVVVEHIQ